VANVGAPVVVTFWLILEVPDTVKVLVFSVSVPVPVVIVLPLTVLAARFPEMVRFPLVSSRSLVSPEDEAVKISLPARLSIIRAETADWPEILATGLSADTP
jgi:hypothetical protein